MQTGTLTAITKRTEDDEYVRKGATEAALDLQESSESDTDNEDIISVGVFTSSIIYVLF